MNTTQLECFLAVAEHLNFARAAEALHITQPAVTHQINSLEGELGTSLFRRTTRSVELTEAGFFFIGDARNILNLSYAAKMRIQHKQETELLPFTIGCHTSMEMLLLPPLIRRVMEEYPNLHPVLTKAPLPILGNHLDDSSIDVLIGFQEKNSQKQSGMYTELLKASPALVVSPEHPLASRDEVSMKDIKEGCVILCDPRQNPQAVVDLQHDLLSFRPSSHIYFCECIESVLTLIKSGIGFTLLPDIPLMRDSSLCYIPFHDKTSASFGLQYKNLKQHPALKKFIQLTKELFAESSD